MTYASRASAENGPVEAAPPVPHVTVVAANPVEGLRALAAERDVSFQVFLWRAHYYLEEQFRDAPFEKVKATMETSGAKQIEEWGADQAAQIHTLRFVIQDDVIQSRVGGAHKSVVEVQHYRKQNSTRVEASIVIELGSDFDTIAAKRDYPKGTVLDRIFALDDLKRRAKDTPRLDRIEISYGPIGYASTPGLGHGFHLEVSLSNPSSSGRLSDQRVFYMACSGLDPLGPFYRQNEKSKLAVHVARDTLVPEQHWETRVTVYSDPWDPMSRPVKVSIELIIQPRRTVPRSSFWPARDPAKDVFRTPRQAPFIPAGARGIFEYAAAR